MRLPCGCRPAGRSTPSTSWRSWRPPAPTASSCAAPRTPGKPSSTAALLVRALPRLLSVGCSAVGMRVLPCLPSCLILQCCGVVGPAPLCSCSTVGLCVLPCLLSAVVQCCAMQALAPKYRVHLNDLNYMLNDLHCILTGAHVL